MYDNYDKETKENLRYFKFRPLNTLVKTRINYNFLNRNWHATVQQNIPLVFGPSISFQIDKFIYKIQ